MMIDEPHLINLQVPLLVTETQEILDKNIRANATENIADFTFREDKMMWWPFCFILTLFFASFAVQAEFNVDKSSEVRDGDPLNKFNSYLPFDCCLFTTLLVQHACATCPSMTNLKLVLAEAVKEEAEGGDPMTVAECFEEAQKKMAINGECIHELEKVCVDHFKEHGDVKKVGEAEGMIGSWEKSSSDKPLPRSILTFISACILLRLTTN